MNAERLLSMMCGCFVALAAMIAIAEENVPGVASHGDWSVFEANGPRECWVSSMSKGKNNRLQMFVTFAPERHVVGEAAIMGKLLFLKDSHVSIQAAGQNLVFLTENNWAWPGSPAEDNRFLEAMKSAHEVRVSGALAQGAEFVDTFSAAGFAVALEDARARCR